MSAVIATTEALSHLRRLPRDRRKLVIARRHPDGGIWMAARAPGGDAIIEELVERFGTRCWRRGGWIVQRVQLSFPGFI